MVTAEKLIHRKFGGKKFRYSISETSKRGANTYAKSMRRFGYDARVVKAKVIAIRPGRRVTDGYDIYLRKRRGRR